jgi:hypothetical protein
MKISVKMVGRDVTRVGLHSLTHFTAIDFARRSIEDSGITDRSYHATLKIKIKPTAAVRNTVGAETLSNSFHLLSLTDNVSGDDELTL